MGLSPVKGLFALAGQLICDCCLGFADSSLFGAENAVLRLFDLGHQEVRDLLRHLHPADELFEVVGRFGRFLDPQLDRALQQLRDDALQAPAPIRRRLGLGGRRRRGEGRAGRGRNHFFGSSGMWGACGPNFSGPYTRA